MGGAARTLGVFLTEDPSAILPGTTARDRLSAPAPRTIGTVTAATSRNDVGSEVPTAIAPTRAGVGSPDP
ncbi:hypothetical protein ACIBF6_32645 [Streptosporangium amethystogenes]|uniref:hypothetical protein n=1 Tax=Streptosporangium amethystogenes TaxID=2002 RepID=UPI003788595E